MPLGREGVDGQVVGVCARFHEPHNTTEESGPDGRAEPGDGDLVVERPVVLLPAAIDHAEHARRVASGKEILRNKRCKVTCGAGGSAWVSKGQHHQVPRRIATATTLG